MKYTDQEIYENRLRAVKYLQKPELKKAVGRLESEIKDGSKCCLGHMCTALEVHRKIDDKGVVHYGGSLERYEAPRELIDALGLSDEAGSAIGKLVLDMSNEEVMSLAALNDDTDITTQEIGKYLEQVIMGGEGTPWKEIKI